jgi:hypothetical protein
MLVSMSVFLSETFLVLTRKVDIQSGVPDPLGPVTLAYVILSGQCSEKSGSRFAFSYREFSSVALFDVGMNWRFEFASKSSL